MRTPKLACIALAFTAAFAGVAAATSAHPDAERILSRAKSAFRDLERPPYVVYTLERVERMDGTIDFIDTYRDRIWYRSADHAALTRRIERGRARGALIFQRPRFNAALDPGPPTADIFERAPARRRSPETPAPEETPPTIAVVAAGVESDYKVRLDADDAQGYHLRLTPRRDPDRNRLRELWIDPDTYAVRRLIATDRLYEGESPDWIPQRMNVALTLRDGLPLITHILTTTDVGGGSPGGVPHEEGEFTFSDVEFPASLPDWYFAPETYGRHVGEAPAW